MRRLALVLVGTLAAAMAAIGPAAAGARLVLDPPATPVDGLVCVCAEGASAPVILHIDGRETPPRTFSAQPAGGNAARVVHLALGWGGSEPLVLMRAIPGRPRTADLPAWGQDGRLGPGDYVLTADGFDPETLRVRSPTPSEDRDRALLARARWRAERGDSAYAARLIESLLDRSGDSPYADAAFLALGNLLPHSRYRDRPDSWISEWIAIRHGRCLVGEGIRVWLALRPDAAGRATLARVAGQYPDTRAALAARTWLDATRREAP